MTTTLLDAVVRLTGEAAAAILSVYERDFAVDHKDDRTPLTDADRASHALIQAGLEALEPGVPVVSEEGDPSLHAVARPRGTFWLVDPLDGTKEFVRRTGEFTVNVALIRDGRPVLGVVRTPVTGRVHTGLVPGGDPASHRAQRIDADGATMPIRTTPADPDHLRLAASRDHGGPLVAALEAAGPASGVSIRRAGSSLKFCLVAEGAADLYVRDGRTMEWDTAAAHCVVEAAGGIVVGLDGASLTYGKPGVDNPSFAAVGDPAFDWQGFLERNASP